jgi:hypothetical protein
MPVGFCCENCILFRKEHACVNISPILDSKKSKTITSKIKLIHASIEGEKLKVIIEQNGKRIPLHFDLNEFLKSV